MSVILVTLVILFGLKCCNSQSLVCCDGALRLVGGSVSNEGRVEICQSGQWKTVCDNNWSENEARVVCRQLGYTTEGAVSQIRASFGMGTGTIVEQIRCNGMESQLADCTIRDVADGECDHNEDAGVRCPCWNGDIRLQGSTILGRGRVEVCINNVWGTICDNSWNSADANVVCSQLGFSRFGALSYCCARYNQGSGPIHMTNVGCVGNESSLTDCPHTTNNNCHHREDASVQCQTRIICHDGDVRLAGGSQPHEGRVEVCFNETWGIICGYIHPWSWNHSQADIVCRQLGYSQAESSTNSFGRGTAHANIAYVWCRGTESSLAECEYSTGQSLSHCVQFNGIIGVHCRSDTIRTGTLRLIDGLTQYEGRVEIYWNSEWNTICNDGWDEADAVIVCRQLGYLPTSVQIHAISYDNHHFKSRRSPLLMSNVGCNGSESNLTTCCSAIFNNVDCYSRNYAGVRCSQCIEDSIKLVGELSQHEGTPVICLGGGWAKVCGASPHAAAAAVVACRQLGFSAEDPTIQAAYFSCIRWFNEDHLDTVGLSFSITNVQCNSNETQLSQCEYTHDISSWDCRFSVFKISCKTPREIIPGAPQNLQISNHYAALNSSNMFNLTLTWSPPPMLETYGLTISMYIINCTNLQLPLQMNSILIRYTDALSVTFSNLCLFTSYNCCVAAISNHGRGKLACVPAPSDAPVRLQSTLITSTTLLLSWHAPIAEYIINIQRYHIQILDSNAGAHAEQMNYTTENTHLLLSNLQPNHRYTFRVAAYANGRGPFSQLTVTTLGQHSPTAIEEDRSAQNSSIISIQHLNQSPLMVTASMLGLVSLILLVVALVAGIYISYRLCKRDKKITRPAQVPVYEMVDVRPQGDSSGKLENLSQEHEDINVEELIFKQDQAKDFSYMPHEYLTSTFTKFDHKAGSCQTVATKEENAYQPLIPPRFRALGDDMSEYKSLTRKTSTLPIKFNIPPVGPAPPAIPPKPKAM